MAKLKMLKYPRKPKQSASIATKERYLARVKEIDRENLRRKAANKRSDDLRKKSASVRAK